MKRISLIGLIFAFFVSGALTGNQATPAQIFSRKPDLYVIVHGTWSCNSKWHSPQGPFFQALAQAVAPTDGMVTSFCWNGAFAHKTRQTAGVALAERIENEWGDYTLHFITHSHGTSVLMLATQELAKKKNFQNRIATVYAFGTPVCEKKYCPNMDVIRHLYHFTSFSDVAPTRLKYARFYTAHPRIANLTFTLDGDAPRHTKMHTPAIGRWLPHLEQLLAATKQSNNTDTFSFDKPGIIHFSRNEAQAPIYEVDTERAYRTAVEQGTHSLYHYRILLKDALEHFRHHGPFPRFLSRFFTRAQQA